MNECSIEVWNDITLGFILFVSNLLTRYIFLLKWYDDNDNVMIINCRRVKRLIGFYKSKVMKFVS